MSSKLDSYGLQPHDKEAQKHHKVAYEAKHPPLRIGSERVCPKDGMVQVYVPAGKFKMGSRDDDPDADNDEKPQHEVYLDAYWIDKTPVTNAMFAKFVQETGYQTEAEKAKSDYTWRHPRGAKKFFGLVGGSDLTGKDNHPEQSSLTPLTTAPTPVGSAANAHNLVW